jgi:hypothetical protein
METTPNARDKGLGLFNDLVLGSFPYNTPKRSIVTS